MPRAELVAAVGDRRLAGTWAAEALRVEAWRPRLGLETDERSIPHELDWLRTAVHLHKGCYRGQETVAKVHNLGRPPRRLTLLHLDGSSHDLPAHGDDVVLEGKRVGSVTTAARHHELGPVALAVLKRSLPVDAELFALAGSAQGGGPAAGRGPGGRRRPLRPAAPARGPDAPGPGGSYSGCGTLRGAVVAQGVAGATGERSWRRSSVSGYQVGGRRALDRVLAPDFLDDLQGMDLPTLREHRTVAEQEEADLSYARRLIQGRLDLLGAEEAAPRRGRRRPRRRSPAPAPTPSSSPR